MKGTFLINSDRLTVIVESSLLSYTFSQLSQQHMGNYLIRNVCVGFYVPLENFSLIWRRHRYQWRANIRAVASLAEGWVFDHCSNRPKSLKQGVTAPLRNARQQVWVSRVLGKDHYINGCSVSQKVWHIKEPSLLNGHECRVYVKFCSPSPVRTGQPQWWHERSLN